MSESGSANTRILIIGGGTAGWMAANLMANAWQGKGVEITLMEASSIGIIGVGEATTPKMRHFFDQLGIPESEWMPRCNATYKCGIRFPNWSERKGFESYYHPFFTLGDQQFAQAFFHNVELRRKNFNVHAHPNVFFVSNNLAEESRAPLAETDIDYVTEYAYHFDSHLVGALLREHAEGLGVRHVVDKFTSVNRHENGDIASVETEEHGTMEADIFVDCTGFGGLLIGRELDVAFHSDRDVLLNDRAVVTREPWPEDMQTLPSEVYSGALKNGWLWKIPLADCMSYGYVYSSDFASADDAEAEMCEFLGLSPDTHEMRHLSIRVGRRDRCWERNCLAIGLSQGFIEPLESTGLFIAQETIESFIQQFEAGGFSDRHRDRVNTRVNAIFDGVRDYIFTHYKINGRTDTEYWIANRENNSGDDMLASELLRVWDNGGDIIGALDAHKSELVYTHTSWVSLLAGTGRYPRHPRKLKPRIQPADLDAVRHNCGHLASYFPDHLSLIRGMYRGREEAVEASDRRAGLDESGERSIQGIDPLHNQ